MKSLLLKTVLLLLFAIAPTKMQAQPYNQAYATINVLNSVGANPHNFIFSYDVINGVHTCMNNFEIINNLNIATSFNFRIFVNNILTYTGNVALNAYGRVFFDNTFTNCYSASSAIRVEVF